VKLSICKIENALSELFDHDMVVVQCQFLSVHINNDTVYKYNGETQIPRTNLPIYEIEPWYYPIASSSSHTFRASGSTPTSVFALLSSMGTEGHDFFILCPASPHLPGLHPL